MQSSRDPKRWEICIHEASHFVFARLIQKLGIGFPQPNEITVSEKPGRQGGTIDGGWVEQNNTAVAQTELGKLYNMPLKHRVVQIMFSLAGYASYKTLVDPEKDQLKLERVILPNCPSDIDKCWKIASRISGNHAVAKDINGNWKINEKSLAVLQPIKLSVEEVLKEKQVRWAVKYCAKKLYNKGVLRGKDL